MKKHEAMDWQTFKQLLIEQPSLELQFQFGSDRLVDASYHITEIKQATVTSVDCGGVMNAWTEIIVQLWEPKIRESERAMKVEKALSIIQLVESKLPLNPLGKVKIEFGNSDFDTRQMFPSEISVVGASLVVNLVPDAVECKAISRGGSCGTTDSAEECCTPEQKPKIQLINLAAVTDTCTPGSGCC
ncbi:MAG: DUF6428 family protein [Pedobacter sp.]|uniref:DUF6428 family protein n=1 Tax=Pedobacter sp. TaxID=1411316 RepID=UPI003395CEF1